MGVFSPIAKRNAYVPPSDAANSPTLLTGADPSLVRVSGGDDPDATSEGHLAQQRPSPARPQPAQPQPSPTQSMAQPGRGYGELPQSQLEQNLSADQKRANREQALHELAQQPPPRGTTLLPDDWERTKPSEVVDDIRRAAQRHGVPTDLLARLLYQEGKFNEPDKLGNNPLVMQSKDTSKALGWAQITTDTVDDLKKKARGRGDLARLADLNAYSPADRAKAFDVAAELLAHQYRMLGSWHASVAGYNIGRNFVQDWLNGLDRSDDQQFTRDPAKVLTYWRRMKAYLGIVFHGKPDEPPSSRIYDYRDPERNIRVPPPVPRSPNTPDRWRISKDEYENP